MSASARRDDGTARIAMGAVLTYLGINGVGAASITFLVGTILAVVFSLVFGLPFDDRALDDRSVTCTGQVLGSTADASFQINNESTVVLRFDCPDVPHTTQWSVRVVASDPAATTRTGDPVIVEYLQDDPTVARVQGSRAAIAPWAGLLGAGLAAVGAVCAVAATAVPILGVVLLVDGTRRRRRWRKGAGEVSSVNA